MKGQKNVFDDVPIKFPELNISVYLNTVWVRNPFESKTFAAFWLLLEQEGAEEFKGEWAYGSCFEMGCDCGSSTCDECNPGWDLVDDEDFEEPDYGI